MKRLLEILDNDFIALTGMFNNMKDLIFIMEFDGVSFRYVYINESVSALLNIENNIIGKCLEDVVEKNRISLLFKQYRKVLVTKKSVTYIERIETINGEFFGESKLSPILTAGGQCKYIMTVVRDITERIQKERELKKSKKLIEKNQKRLHSLIENNSDAVFECNLNGNFVYINEKYKELTGYTEKEILGHSFHSQIVEEYVDSTMTHFHNALNGSKEEYETWITSHTGQNIQVRVKNVPIIIDGILDGVYGLAEDITNETRLLEELHHKNEELRKSREKYRIITKNAFDAIKLIDPSGIIEYVSPANKKTLGYQSAEYIGKTITHNIHPEDVAIFDEKYNKLMQGEESELIEFRVRHRDGHYIWMEASMTPVLETGELKQIVTIERDITEKKRFREELEKAAFYDYLSGLPNRRSFHERLDIAIEQSKNNQKKIAVMMIDGRKFKLINDRYGHDTGDAVIREMARRIEQVIRKSDTVARIGGDEMAVILPELNCETEAEEIAKRILQMFENPLKYNGYEIKIGVSIGIAFYPKNSQEKRLLLNLADEALYSAKHCNHDKYFVYNEN